MAVFVSCASRRWHWEESKHGDGCTYRKTHLHTIDSDADDWTDHGSWCDRMCNVLSCRRFSIPTMLVPLHSIFHHWWTSWMFWEWSVVVCCCYLLSFKSIAVSSLLTFHVLFFLVFRTCIIFCKLGAVWCSEIPPTLRTHKPFRPNRLLHSRPLTLRTHHKPFS